MSIRLPKNPENLTSQHADRCIAAAWKAFAIYEAKVDFSRPQDEINDLYRPYQLAREQACQVAAYTCWRRREAEALP